MKYHGQVVIYDIDNGTVQQKQAFKKSLPRRSDFIEGSVAEDIKAGKPVLFCSNTTFENHYRNERNNLTYCLSLIGVLRDGSKAAVVITDCPVFFEVRVPDNTDPTCFMENLRELIIGAELYLVGCEIVMRKPFKLFNINPIPYIRLLFNTTHQRTKALAAVRSGFKYTDLMGKDQTLKNPETGYDDSTSSASKYFRQMARMFKFNVAGWNTVSKYTIDTDTYFKSSHISYTLVISVSDIESIQGKIDPQTQDEYRDLLFDKSMTCAWDLETYSRIETGRAPMPSNVFEGGAALDMIFMDSITFRWYWSTKSMLKVCITDIPCPPHPDCLIIQCQNQMELIKLKMLIIGLMCPDFITGYNDGQYDWPFIFKRIKKYSTKHNAGVNYNPSWANLMNFVRSQAAVIPFSPTDKYIPIRGQAKETIKIDNGLDYKMKMLDVPGILCFDMKCVLTVMYPKSEKFSLNYFLGKFKLPNKEDMPYLTMFKIYRMVRYFKSALGQFVSYSEIIQYIKTHISIHGESHLMFESLSENTGGVRESTYGVGKLEAIQILRMIEEGIPQIVTYCNYDADCLHDIIRVQNIIPDKREIAKLSYTSIYDAFYRAGGMKVRNMAMSYMCDPAWNMICSSAGNNSKDGRKYPGAYVVPPKKGLYRDHKFIKHARCGKGQVSLDTVSPDSASFNPEFINGVCQPDNADTDGQSSRPSAGLDFASLYPSIMMTYNISADSMVTCPDRRDQLVKMGYELVEISFLFGFQDEPDSQKQPVLAWAVQHRHPQRKILQAEVERARKIDPDNWVKHIDKKIADSAVTAFRSTTMDQWREYGMGLFPFILRDLFIKRSQVKKLMDQFTKPKEWIDEYLGTSPQTDDLESEKRFAMEALTQMLAARQREYDMYKKNFYKYRIFDAEDIIKFMKTNWITGVYSHLRIRELRSECAFKASYYNTNQLAQKIFMNTFYGETGNQQSSMFLLPVAGGVTTFGQYNIRMVKAYVEKIGFNVLYGDTDSLYICPQDKYFTELDALFESGQISRREYWTRMIEITMEVMNTTKDEVNRMLMFDNFTAFLNMAYEEVLFPLLLTGKKKYAGIPHLGIVNLAMCEAGVRLDEFMKPGRIFIRGLELIKRGVSAIAKQISYEILLETFSLSEVRTVRAITEDKLAEITARKWDVPLFAKSAVYKLPTMNHAKGKLNPGNVSVLNFVDRMRNIQAQYPKMGIDPPEVGMRFQYIITKKYPWTYDFRGNQKNISKADQYEYLHAFDNAEYVKMCGGLEIDIEYYITSEIVGHFARFILYHPDFADIKFDYSDKEAYKAADAAARKRAVDLLKAYYNQRFSTKYTNRGPIYKKIHSSVDSIMTTKLASVVGDSVKILKIVKPVNVEQYLSGGVAGSSQLVGHMCEHARKTSVRYCCNLPIQNLMRISDNPQQLLRCTVLSKDSYYSMRYSLLKQAEHSLRAEISELMPALQKISALSIDSLARSVTNIAEQNHVNQMTSVEGVQVPVSEADIDISAVLSDPELDYLDVLYDKYMDLISVYKQFAELESYRNSARTYSSLKTNPESMPCGFIKRNLKEDYEDFVRRRFAKK